MAKVELIVATKRAPFDGSVEAECDLARSRCIILDRLIRNSESGYPWLPKWQQAGDARKMVLENHVQIDLTLKAHAEFLEQYNALIRQLRDQHVPQAVRRVRLIIKQLERLTEAIDLNDTKRAIHVLAQTSLDTTAKREIRKKIVDYTAYKSRKAIFEGSTLLASKRFLPGPGRDKERDQYIDRYIKGREELLGLCLRLITTLRCDIERTYESDPDNLHEIACTKLRPKKLELQEHRTILETKSNDALVMIQRVEHFNKLVTRLNNLGDEGANFFFNPPDLSQHDYDLVNNWLGNQSIVNFDYWRKAFVSARRAELIAYEIYQQLYGFCNDLSIKQVIGSQDGRWRLADLESESGLIDVKNARSTRGNDQSNYVYSEHLIPKFKETRSGNDVILSTFYTDYQSEILLWLGETTRSSINILLQHQWSPYLDVQLRTEGAKTFIPPWLCDYPSAVYEQRRNLFEKLQEQLHLAPPMYKIDYTAAIVLNLIPACEEDAHSNETPLLYESYLMQERIKELELSRPTVYLHILSRFVDAIANGREFNSEALTKITKFHDMPLYIADPAKSIYTLISILDRVQRRSGDHLQQFKFFKLVHPQILRGITSTGMTQTILAYCGGWLPGGGPKCGKYPLYLGQNEVCEECGKLICDACGFCTETCGLNSPRQQLFLNA